MRAAAFRRVVALLLVTLLGTWVRSATLSGREADRWVAIRFRLAGLRADAEA